MVKFPSRLYGMSMPFLPDLPAFVAGHGRAVLLTADGPATLKRLGNPAIQVLDLLELFAFVCPAQSLAPTPAGLARALDMDIPASQEEAASALSAMAQALLARLAAGKNVPANQDAPGLAARMGAAG